MEIDETKSDEVVNKDYGQPTESTVNTVNDIVNCADGQKYNEETHKCEDDNLCLLLRNPCGDNMECENVLGQFKCHMKKVNSTHCPDGYKMNSSYCEDINECEDQSKCAKPKVCNNYEGGYTCFTPNENGNLINASITPFVDINSIDANLNSCPNGYALNDDAECEDIDECIEQKHNCKQGTTCKNTDGSFICEKINCEAGKIRNVEGRCVYSPIQKSITTENSNSNNHSNTLLNDNTSTNFNLSDCDTGYRLSEEDPECTDIDECLEKTHDCKHGTTCKNTDGSFICEEIKYEGGESVIARRKCDDLPPNKICSQGYTFNLEINECEDIDECELHKNSCKENEECENTPGSYTCVLSCVFGMRGENGKCVDIDECSEKTNNCTDNQMCVNKHIGYECIQLMTAVDIFQCFVDGIESVETVNSTCNQNLFPLSIECQKVFRKGCEYELNTKLCQHGINYAMSGYSCFENDTLGENSLSFLCCKLCFKGKLEFIVRRHCQANQEHNVSSYNVKSQCCRKMELKQAIHN
ncbi:fibrillin-2-like isoform X12 [Leptotrombidium deliense]|uniref:Fibrillin-2-like isoform X12 n=1 Tax=Leptotrombidium deliense TaxID=299467 RepID=A0A443S4E3_9ACAR|nr:fibrillin-2-like isoform X12 [Leptotrombidium deliense]